MSTARLPLTCEQQPCPPAWDGSASGQETFHMVPLASSEFTHEFLPILQQAYLDASSGSYFQYNQVTLVKNAKLLDQYNACRRNMEEKGYYKEELAESFAFLLFETEDQAKTVCQEGLQNGGSNITTLGDPLKGVYLCQYSDFLHPTPWYHGKCGYILIFKIIKGRVKSMIENYTADLTSPSAGYNCHVSINTNKVSSRTSHFQAFELTQYYLYEFGQCDLLQCPRQIYPYAVVAFEYCDSKCIMAKSGEIEIHVPETRAVQYYPWKGKLINKSKAISVALKSNGSALMPVVLPAKLEIEYVMDFGELKSSLPLAVFERENFNFQEVCLEGLYCSWYELVEYAEGREVPQLGPLMDEMKEKNVAVVKCLNDQGLLILFSDSVSSSARETSRAIPNAVQAVFIFKASRIAHLKEVNGATRTRPISLCSDRIAPLLPGIGYAVTKVLKSTGAWAIPCNKLVEDHLADYFKVTPELPLSSEHMCDDTDRCPQLTAGSPPNNGEPPARRDGQRTSVDQLSPYFIDPESYILPVSTVLKLQGNCLQLCRSFGAEQKTLRLSKPREATYPREKRKSKARKAQEKSPAPGRARAGKAPPRSGAKERAATRSQTNREPRKASGRAEPAGKPTGCKATGKGAGKVKRKKGSPLPADAAAETPGISKGANSAPRGVAAIAASGRPGYSTRSQSAHNSKKHSAQSGKGGPVEQPALPDGKRKNPCAADGHLQTDSKRGAAARKAVSGGRGSGKAAAEKQAKRRGETVCVTGVNNEHFSRYGVCTWNIVEKNDVENEPASLQPLPSGTGSNTLRAKKAPTEASQVPQGGVGTNIGATDPLTFLADLAISSAIAALPPWPKQKCGLALPQAPGKSAPCKNGSVGSKRQSNRGPHLDGLPNSESRVPNTMPPGAENSQGGSGEPSDNRPSRSAASLGSRCFPGAASAFSSRGMLHMHNYMTRGPKEGAHRSSAYPRIAHLFGDHSYSRPPRDREPVGLAVASPVPSQKEDAALQSTSVHVESASRCSAGLDPQSRSQTSLSLAEACSKDEERSYEEGTLIGRVLPFRREDTCRTNVTHWAADGQKKNGALRRYGQAVDYTWTEFDEQFQQSRCICDEKDTLQVTFEWKGPYLFQWDSKYTNDSLEKSVNRALHGPWDPTIQETMKEVKLILHMWIGLFYTKSSMMLQTSIRQVEERIETLDAAAAAAEGDLCQGPAGVGAPASVESGSESASSDQHRMAGVIVSSVIKRIEKHSNLVTSCDSNSPFCGETLPAARSQPEEEGPLGSDDVISCDNAKDPEAQNSSGGLLDISTAEKQYYEQESTIDPCAARLENERPEDDPRLSPVSDRRTETDIILYNGIQDPTTGSLSEGEFVDASQTDDRETSSVIKETESIQQHAQEESEVMESQSSSVLLSTHPMAVVEMSRSVDTVDGLVIETGQLGNSRQSSVIRELLGIQFQTPKPSLNEENTNSRNVDASGSCQKLNESSENSLQTKWLDNLTASEDIQSTTCTEDLGTIEDTLATERNVSHDHSDGVDHSDAASQSFTSTKEVLAINTVNTSETSIVIAHNYGTSLGPSNPLDSTDGPLAEGSTCSPAETCTDVRLIRDDTETQRERPSVGRLPGEGEVAGDSDPECPDLDCMPAADELADNLNALSAGDECTSHTQPPALSSHNGTESPSAQQREKEFEKANQCNTDSERSDCSHDVSKEPIFTLERLTTDDEIQPSVRDISENTQSRSSHHARSRKRKRKRKAPREKKQCFSDLDSEHGNFRESWISNRGHLQMRTVDMNYLPHIFEENNMAVARSDSDDTVALGVRIPDPFARQKVYQNFSVTAETQHVPSRPFPCERITRTFCNCKKKSFVSSTPQSLGQWDTRCWSKISPVQKILDLEYIHFSRHLNSLLHRAHSAPYTNVFSPSRDAGKAALRRRNTHTVSSGRLIGRRNPLTVTISCREVDQSSGRRLRNKTQRPHWTNIDDEVWNWPQEGAAFCKPKNSASCASKRKRPCSQSRAMCLNSVEPTSRMPSKPRPVGAKGSLFAQELSRVKRKGRKELHGDGRKRSNPFLRLITELCSDLHQNLNEVAKESWKGTYTFYVSETSSDPFFKEIKESLKKEGHVEIGPMDLSLVQPHHSGKLLVIIRNEDISAHLHQIPHLTALKQMPCVQFVGVDNPGDIKDQTFQELFSSGGFVVSDGTVLDTVAPEHLQQISDLLEQLSSERKWRWLIHFKELKKLKEMAREDNTAKRKISLLTRKITANIVEVLPFHECDSRCQVKPDYLCCLVKLQVQRISSRFAVFLTGKPESRDLFTQSGILVTDVNSFTKGLRRLSTHLQSTLATNNALLAEGGHSTDTQLE
uniref:uncharacterized protein n=1 Tax=Pristiophorus japonicus TaxID=55135 RepID=UPI00398F1CB1